MSCSNIWMKSENINLKGDSKNWMLFSDFLKVKGWPQKKYMERKKIILHWITMKPWHTGFNDYKNENNPCSHALSWIVTYIVHNQNSYRKTVSNNFHTISFKYVHTIWRALYQAFLCWNMPCKTFPYQQALQLCKTFCSKLCNFILCLGELEQLFFSLYKRQYICTIAWPHWLC